MISQHDMITEMNILTLLTTGGSVYLRRLEGGHRQLCVVIVAGRKHANSEQGVDWLRHTLRCGSVNGTGAARRWIAVSAQAREFLTWAKSKYATTLPGAEAMMAKKIDDILWLDAQFSKPRRGRNTYDR